VLEGFSAAVMKFAELRVHDTSHTGEEPSVDEKERDAYDDCGPGQKTEDDS